MKIGKKKHGIVGYFRFKKEKSVTCYSLDWVLYKAQNNII